MKALRARYTPEAASLIRTLHPEVKRRIRTGIRHLLENPFSGHELHTEGYSKGKAPENQWVFATPGSKTLPECRFFAPLRMTCSDIRMTCGEEGSRWGKIWSRKKAKIIIHADGGGLRAV